MGMMDKAKDLLNSDKGEQITDKGLDKATEMISERTGGTFDSHLEKGRDMADERIGAEGATDSRQATVEGNAADLQGRDEI